MISTIVKIPIQTTKRIKVFELLNSFSVFPFLSAISIITNSQPYKRHMRHMKTFYSYYSNNSNLLHASPMHSTRTPQGVSVLL